MNHKILKLARVNWNFIKILVFEILMNEKKKFQTLVKFLRIFHESKQSFSNHDALKFLFWNPILDTQLQKKRKKGHAKKRYKR